MRRPICVKHPRLKNARGDAQGGEALLWGEPRFYGVGEPSRPGFPRRGKRERGDSIPRCRRRLFYSLPNTDSPCFHPHSLWSILLRRHLGFSISTGAAISGSNWEASLPKLSFQRDFAVARTRRLGFQSKTVSCQAAAVRLCLVFLNGSYTSPLAHKWCRRMASFRPTATTALFLAFFPPRPASFVPQRFRSESGAG